MFSSIKAYVTSYAATGLAIALAASLAWNGLQSTRLSASRRDTAEVKAAWAQDKANALALALKTSEEYRAKEAEDQAKIKQGETDYAALQAKHAATVAASQRDTRILRDQLAAYAGPSIAASDPCSADRRHAQALGLLLGDGVRLQEQLAQGAESSSDAVRTLLATWPTNVRRLSAEPSPIKPRP